MAAVMVTAVLLVHGCSNGNCCPIGTWCCSATECCQPDEADSTKLKRVNKTKGLKISRNTNR